MLTPQAKSVKEWLQAYVEMEKVIDNNYEHYRRLEARVSTVGAVEITDMPRGSGSGTDQLSNYLIKKEHLSQKIDAQIRQHNLDRQIIRELTSELGQTESATIRFRYLAALEWREIICRMFGDNEDFTEHLEGYTRRVYRAHDSALEKMALIWSKK